MRLGVYEIEREVGRGGMGVVLRARAPDGQTVAVKVLTTPDRQDALARFEREARLLSSLGASDGFVPLLDRGTSPNGPFLVMPFLGGGTLRDRLGRGRGSPSEAAALGATLATALGRAHARGIVHRDLKPENVLFTGDGRPLIADLGLAKHFTKDTAGASLSVSLSVHGEARGTIGYLAPEQLRDAKSSGPPADVFALGAILYELLAGTPAFQGGSPLEVLARIESSGFEPLRSVSPDTPRWLVRVVERCLAHDPAGRFAEGGALARALLAGPPAHAGWVTWAAALLGAGLVAGTVAAVVLARPAAPAAAPPPPPLRAAPIVVPQAPPVVVEPPPPLPELTSGFRSTPRTRLVAVMGAHEWKLADPVWRVVPSPDGKTLAVAGARTLALLDALTGAELWAWPDAHGGAVHAAAFSADGSRLLTGGDDKLVRLWDVTGKAPVEVVTLRGHQGRVQAVRFSPDRQLAVSGGEDATPRVWHLGAGRTLRQLKGHEALVSAVDFLPDGRRVVTASFDKTLRLWDVESGKTLATFRGHEGVVANVAALPDGRRLLSSAEDLTLRLWDVASGKELARLRGHEGYPYGLSVSRDGRRALSSGNDALLKLWDLDEPKELGTLRGHFHWTAACALFADGRTAASASFDRTVRVWDLASGAEVRTPAGHRSDVTTVAVAPDGKQVATGSTDGAARLWGAARGEERRRIAKHGAPVQSVGFAPDGQSVVSTSAEGVSLSRLDGDASRLIPLAGARAAHLLRDGRRVAAAVAGELRFRELDGAQWRALRGHASPIRCFVVAPKGPLAVTGGEDGVARLEGHAAPVTAADVSSDERLVLTGSEDGTARVWDAQSGIATRTLATRKVKILAVAFSPDAARALVADEDRTIALFSLATGAELDRIDLRSSRDNAQALAFGPDGKWFVAGTARGVGLRFDLLD